MPIYWNKDSPALDVISNHASDWLESALEDPRWYVLRTRQHKERVVQQLARELVEETYLPLFKGRCVLRGRAIEKIEPLFPCYLFARLKLKQNHYKLTHTPGVSGIVRIGGSGPCEIEPSIIERLKSHETNGVIIPNVEVLRPRELVTITDGPFRGIDAVFERYLSGAERVSVLLGALGRSNLRVMLNVNAIIRANREDAA